VLDEIEGRNPAAQHQDEGSADAPEHIAKMLTLADSVEVCQEYGDDH